ncbi:hypothetical protein EYF80_053862 [Liparis tanakae]|uniref:Uncharacterized protein n=1 Tax=Liparis tanakae TaxID=230148 RepID=A0A4Z2F694_9TELE|nr:hypothetical protein EYF80_053862 [Liparis tanakae]
MTTDLLRSVKVTLEVKVVGGGLITMSLHEAPQRKKSPDVNVFTEAITPPSPGHLPGTESDIKVEGRRSYERSAAGS